MEPCLRLISIHAAEERIRSLFGNIVLCGCDCLHLWDEKG